MSENANDPAIEFMKELDKRFRAASGLNDRRDYSIFYSRIHPSPAMVIGIKPGGRRDGSHLLASQSFYEDWSHEYVDMNYRIASVMRPTLMRALGTTDADDLRAVPKTNCFFHRAVGTDDLTAAQVRDYAELCAPFLASMLTVVNPKAVVLEGNAARDLFVRHQCDHVSGVDGSKILGMRRGSMNTFFRAEKAILHSTGEEVQLLTLGHPSQFGHLPEWEDATASLRTYLGPSYLPDKAGVRLPQRSIAAAPLDSQINTSTQSGSQPIHARTEACMTNDERLFRPAARPPATFRYSPIHDFWQEMQTTAPITVDAFFSHLMEVGWKRPSGKPLTPKIVRTDLVSMVKHGFAVVEVL